MQRLLQTIAHWDFLILLFILPGVMFASGPLSLLLLIIPLLWVIRRFATGHFISPTPHDTTLLVLALALLISLYAIFDPALSFPKIAGLVMGISLFYAAVAYTREHIHGKWHLVGLIGLAGVGIALIGLIGAKWVGPFSPLNRISELLPGQLSRIPGAVGGIVNLNELAGVLGWVAPLMIACLLGFGLQLWRNQKVILLGLTGVVLLTSSLLVASMSRGGIAGFGLALLIMLALRYRWARWALLIAIIAGFGLAIYYNLGDLLLGGDASDEFGLDGRLEIWSRAIYGLQDFPFTGMSMNGFRRVVHILYPLFLISPDVDLAHAHNHLLQAGLDLGFGGLVAYIGLWIGSVILIWRGLSGALDSNNRVLLIGFAGSLTAGWMFGLLDAIALGARPGFVWWLLLAGLVATFDSVRREQVSAEATPVAHEAEQVSAEVPPPKSA